MFSIIAFVVSSLLLSLYLDFRLRLHNFQTYSFWFQYKLDYSTDIGLGRMYLSKIKIYMFNSHFFRYYHKRINNLCFIYFLARTDIYRDINMVKMLYWVIYRKTKVMCKYSNLKTFWNMNELDPNSCNDSNLYVNDTYCGRKTKFIAFLSASWKSSSNFQFVLI